MQGIEVAPPYFMLPRAQRFAQPNGQAHDKAVQLTTTIGLTLQIVCTSICDIIYSRFQAAYGALTVMAV